MDKLGLIIILAHLRIEAGLPDLKPAERFLQRLLECAADGHDLADRLHLGGQAVISIRELLEIEAGNLGDDIVEGRLERAGSPVSGDVVLELVEGIAYGKLRGNLRDREAGGLRCKC